MISTQIKHSVAWVLIDRPEQKNALSIQLLEQLLVELKRNDKNDEVKLSVIFGEDNFSSGGDIKDMNIEDEKSAKELAHKVQGIYTEISQIEKPIIAYTKGLVYGGGFELALVCDFIISHSNAKFSLPEAALGIIPGGGATQRLKSTIGKQNAAYLLLTGHAFSAEKMLRLNVIQEIEDRIEDVESITISIAQKNLNAVKELKRLLKKDLDFKAESESFAKLLVGEGKKGIQSFISNKKPPVW